MVQLWDEVFNRGVAHSCTPLNKESSMSNTFDLHNIFRNLVKIIIRIVVEEITSFDPDQSTGTRNPLAHGAEDEKSDRTPNGDAS